MSANDSKAGDYLRVGLPHYSVRAVSDGGRFKSCLHLTRDSDDVSDFAAALASRVAGSIDAKHERFSDCLLVVGDINLIARDGTHKAVAVYRWSPKAGEWSHSSGLRIKGVDELR